MTRAIAPWLTAAATAIAAVACATPAGGTMAGWAAPPGAIGEVDAAAEPAAVQLRAFVDARAGDGRQVASARYFRLQAVIGWDALSKFVAGQRGRAGERPPPRWHEGGLDLLDIYPATNGRPATAVAMAREPLADGSKLAGYFELR